MMLDIERGQKTLRWRFFFQFIVASLLVTIIMGAIIFRTIRSNLLDDYAQRAMETMNRYEERIHVLLSLEEENLALLYRISSPKEYGNLLRILIEKEKYNASWIVNRGGTVTFADNPLFLGYSFLGNHVFKKALLQEEPSIHICFDHTIHSRTIQIAFPLFLDDGRFEQIAIHELNPDWIEEILAAEHSEQEDILLLSNGGVVFLGFGDSIYRRGFYEPGRPPSLHDFGLSLAEIKGAGLQYQKIVRDDHLVTYKRMEGPLGIIAHRVSVEKIENDLWSLFYLVLLGSFIALLLFFPLGNYHAARAMRPIERLSKEVELTLKGEQEEIQEPHKEFSLLVHAFNRAYAEKREAQRERELTYQGFKTVLDSMDTAIYVVDLKNHTTLFLNRAGEEAWGQKAKKSPFILPFIKERAHTNQSFTPSTERSWESFDQKDNTWLEYREMSIHWFDGREVLLGMARDITERKQREELLQTNWFIKSILESLPYPFLVIDRESRKIQLANSTAYQLGSKDAKTCYDLIYNRNKPCEECIINTIVETREPITFEKIQKDKEGRREVLEAHSYPIFNDRREVAKIIYYTIDITERKEAEERLKEYTKDIEEKRKEIEDLYHQLDQEIEKAVKVHERSLPKTIPQIEEISIGAYYQPAKKLGGDFYHVIKKEDRLFIYLSDVTGHGIDGAMVSAFIKEAIESYLSLKKDTTSPGSILSHLDRQYRRENYPEEYFICIFLLVIDLNTFEASYLGAGFQNPPLLKIGQRQMYLVNSGLPISTTIPRELLAFKEKRVLLTKNSSLLLTTDGLPDQKRGRENYDNRLQEIFFKNASDPPEVIIHRIKEDFKDYNGSLQGDDDITLLVLEVEPERRKGRHIEIERDMQGLKRLQKWALSLEDLKLEEKILSSLEELIVLLIEHDQDRKKTLKIHVQIDPKLIFVTIEVEEEEFFREDRLKSFIEKIKREENRLVIERESYTTAFLNDRGNKAFLLVEKNGISN